jgi:hypothetical protein
LAAASGIVVRHGLPRRLAPLGAGLSHQALDAVAPNGLAGAVKRLAHPPLAVGAVVGLVDVADDAAQALVFDHAL